MLVLWHCVVGRETYHQLLSTYPINSLKLFIMKKTITIITVAIILASCSTQKKFNVNACPVKWSDSVYNPDNEDYVEEVAFNLGISDTAVTQEQFNERYIGD